MTLCGLGHHPSMNATLHPGNGSTPQAQEVLRLMDALAARERSTDEFLREVLQREHDDPDLPWEVLAQLDQYYRRKKIAHDVFVSLKARLQKESLYLGSGDADLLTDDGEFDVELLPENRPTAPRLVIKEPPLPAEAISVPAARPPPAAPPAPATSEPAVTETVLREPAPSVASATTPPHGVAPVSRPSVQADIAPTAAPAREPVSVQKLHVEPAQRGALRAGDLLRGRYRIVEVLRRDQSGLLLEAVDEQRVNVTVRQRVSILLFDARRSAEPELVQRLCRLQSLSHPCILRMFDIDQDQGELFVTMEWLTGMSLQQLIASNGGAKLNEATARTIIRAVASALAYAHSRDVLHGDVNAANILVTETGEIRLRDFELRGRNAASSPVADRLAFAWLAYELLSGLSMLEFGNLRRARSSELRRPPGVTSAQWQVLRDTLIGREGQSGNILTAFAGDELADARFAPLKAFSYSAPARSPLGRMALGAAAAIVAIGAWLFVDMRDEPANARAPVSAQPAQQASTVAVPPVAPPVVAPAVVAGTRNAQGEVAAAGVRSRARLDLPSTTVEVVGDQPFARVWVRRRDNLEGTVSFRWWTETGSAVLNRDFLRIQPRTEVIPAGDRGMELRVPLLTDPTRVQPRTFYVKIDDPGAGATLGASTLTQITIIPAGAANPDSAMAAPVPDARLAQSQR